MRRVFSTVSSEDLQVDRRVCVACITLHLSCAPNSQTRLSVYSSTLTSTSSSLSTSSAHWTDLGKEKKRTDVANPQIWE